jgi:zinc/manganese transport system substrate-binding protein
MRRATGWRAALILGFGLLLFATACSSSSPSEASASGKIQVVAAESFWGSIATQLGGDRVDVTSIITSPDTDPHDYEPTPQDGRTIASAQYVIFNGVGYDGWAGQAVDANPASNRSVLEIGKLLGLKDGDNPHLWYFPDDVEKVIAQITADYKKIDPADAAYFDQQRQTFETTGLKHYKDLLAEMKQKYAGTPVGASESIFVGIAQASGLDLKTPPDFLTAISEGTDPTAQDKATVDAQVTGLQIKVFVYNSQNSTPDVSALVSAARAAGIPVTTITETPPENTSFEDWQSGQLQQLVDALAQATGK